MRQKQETSPTVLHEHIKAQPVRGLKKVDRENMRTKDLRSHNLVPSERDPRRSLMPSAMQRSALESSFGMNNLDSQVIFLNEDIVLYCLITCACSLIDMCTIVIGIIIIK